jgi:hypothetical protein
MIDSYLSLGVVFWQHQTLRKSFLTLFLSGVKRTEEGSEDDSYFHWESCWSFGEVSFDTFPVNE